VANRWRKNEDVFSRIDTIMTDRQTDIFRQHSPRYA